MKRRFVGRTFGLAVAMGTLLGAVSAASADVVIETVPVGNAGNAVDPADGDISTIRMEHYGAVGYNYNIGKYEVTAGQYTAFLNAVARVDTYSLYNTNMWSNDYGCKIECYAGSGTAGDPYQYRVAADYADRPVNYVTFWDACRFANWLTNGQGGAGTTEYGTYALNGVVSPTNTSITRDTAGTWAVTSEDEWYKAAYYNPDTSSYFLYPTSSNTPPSNVGADDYTDPGNHANVYNGQYTIGSPYWRTKVGEFENSDSPYGTFDQSGNVWEWNEAIIAGSYRGVRGGVFYEYVGASPSCWRSNAKPTYDFYSIGFRVSQVPEPASLALLGLGLAATVIRRRGGGSEGEFRR